ncbi:AraC family transcriptional regulator [Devosia ginsengisoli]|uniref:AraC family transcriptional regulator n=1 Tax=Devosia ginsengisoli TaxID=400770 RepID=A0A5B8LSR7_9HYPH|nr:AraC family transcriptional regulator [Devosia ginsengisoli]QDZ10300.1 AraC family transcriptional regulator [Devosia ginsengisoli]
MTDIHFQPSPLSDPLGEVLHMLRLTGTLYCRAEMTAPWGIVMPDLVDSMMFVIVTSGQSWLKMAGEEPALLAQGSMVLLPHGKSYELLSAPDAVPEPLFDIPVEKIGDRYEIMRHGGGGAVTRATSGVVQFDSVAAKRLVSLLPPVLRVDAWDVDDGDWLRSTLGLIAREASAMRPGGETVMTRLADILVIQAIRAWLARAPEANLGWLAALRDRQIGRTLALMHRQPDRDWSLVDLAGEAGMSRSAFSARFTELVGQPAAQYLAQWRLHLARAQLLEGREAVGAVARRAGYQSEAAFGRAFKQFFGVPPGAARKLMA